MRHTAPIMCSARTGRGRPVRPAMPSHRPVPYQGTGPGSTHGPAAEGLSTGPSRGPVDWAQPRACRLGPAGPIRVHPALGASAGPACTGSARRDPSRAAGPVLGGTAPGPPARAPAVGHRQPGAAAFHSSRQPQQYGGRIAERGSPLAAAAPPDPPWQQLPLLTPLPSSPSLLPTLRSGLKPSPAPPLPRLTLRSWLNRSSNRTPSSTW
jgi:hypothetical protein